jgi:membrane-bound lytic murein transglycosylase D
MLRAVSEVGSSDLVEIIRNYSSPAFGFASKNFYAEFVAALQVAREKEHHFPNLEYHPPLALEEWELRGSLSLDALLKATGVSRDKFLEWNPALSPKIKEVPKGYRVKLPLEKLPSLQMVSQRQGNSLAVAAHEKSVSGGAVSWIRHRVLHGQTLSEIARIYQISVRQLMKINRLSSAHRITAGQWLKIPKV